MLFLDRSRRIYGTLGSLLGVRGIQSEKYFRTMNVEWIGRWVLFAVVAIPEINNLHAGNTPDSSTPAASTKYTFCNRS